MKYDAVIVGGRVAGSAAAYLMAREGLRVLVLDQARFPSDTLSTHQLHVPGGALLAKWGLLDRLDGTPATRRARFEAAGVSFEGALPTVGDNDALYSPRRTVLDTGLVQAAREAGAEVREATIVEDVLRDGESVTGVRCREKHGTTYDVAAPLVVGADGRRSRVARAVGATPMLVYPVSTVAFYTYWQGVPLDHGWIVGGDGFAAGAWPTNGGLTITYLARPAAFAAQVQADPEAAVRSTLVATGELGECVLSGSRVEPVRATTDVPNRIMRSVGQGWTLIGDAGLVMDPITGQGMTNALRDAELLATAVVAGRPLSSYQKARDRATKAMLQLTVGLAALKSSTAAETRMFSAVRDRPGEPERFLAAISGASPLASFFGPRHLVSLVGLGGVAGLARSRPRPPRQPRAPAEAAAG
jgi:flavin-dependent dehydrogenase